MQSSKNLEGNAEANVNSEHKNPKNLHENEEIDLVNEMPTI